MGFMWSYRCCQSVGFLAVCVSASFVGGGMGVAWMDSSFCGV